MVCVNSRETRDAMVRSMLASEEISGSWYGWFISFSNFDHLAALNGWEGKNWVDLEYKSSNIGV